MTVTPNTKLENYVIEKEIGRGDLTIVFQGYRKSDNAEVAIKTVAPQFMFDERFVRRIKEAAQHAIRLEHPNIVRTYEVNQEGDILYVVREYIEAQSLASILENEGPFTPQRMLVIARQIANALDYAHQKSIMHGDLSTRRVYIGQNDYVTVADFGHTQAMAGTSLVKQGFAVGSPEIMAPERVHGQGPSRQSDLYSLGVLCYQILQGEPPFTGEPAAVLHAQAYEQPRPLHMINPGVSVPLSETIGRILSKGLELRYNTGSEFTRALTVATEGSAPVQRVRSATGEMNVTVGTAKPLFQRPWFWAVVAIPIILMLLVTGFIGISAWVAFQPEILSTPTAVAEVMAEKTPSPTSVVSVATEEISTSAEATPEPTETSVGLPSTTPSPTAIPATPTQTPTLVPLPTPGPPTVLQGSPFTNLSLAHGITDNNQPEKVGLSFAPGTLPIYLFFDYANIPPGTQWTHRWQWADTELGAYDDVWPDNYYETGTAWVFFSPTGGYLPGPYQVTIEVQGKTVATATFVIEAGGL